MLSCLQLEPIDFVPLSGTTYRFNYFILASDLTNYLNANATGAVFLFSDEHVENFGTPKISKLLSHLID